MESASEKPHPSAAEYQQEEVDGGHSPFAADILSTPDQPSLGPHAIGGRQFLDTQPTNALSTTNSTSLAPATARLEWEQDDDKRQPHQQDQDQDRRHNYPAHGPLSLAQRVTNPLSLQLQQGPHLPAAPDHEHPIPSVLGETAGPFSLAAVPLPTGHPWQQYQHHQHHQHQQHQLAWPTAGVAVNDASLGLSDDGAGAYMPHGDVDPSFQPNAFVRRGHGHEGAGGVGSASVAATASFGSLASQQAVGVFDNQTGSAFFTPHDGWAMQVGQAQAQDHHFGQQPITYQPGLAATFFPYQHQHTQQSQQEQQHQLPVEPAAAFAAGSYQQQLYYHPSQPQGQDHHTSRSAHSSHLIHHIAQPLGPGIAFPASGNLTMARRDRRNDAGAVGGGCNSSPSSPEHLPGHNPYDILPAQGPPPFKPETAQSHQLDANNEQAFPQICWPTTPPPSRGQWPVDSAQYADGMMFPHQLPVCDGLPTDSWYSRAAADPGSNQIATVSPKDIRFPPVAPPPPPSDEPFRTNLFGGAHDNDGPYVLDAQADPSRLYLDRASPSLHMSEWPQQQPAAYPSEPTLLEMHKDLFYQVIAEGEDAPGSNVNSTVDENGRPARGGTSSSSARQKKSSRGHQKHDSASQKRKEQPTERPPGRRTSAIPDLRPGRKASLSRQDTATAAAGVSLTPMADMHQHMGVMDVGAGGRRSSTAGNKPKRRGGVDSHDQQHYQGTWEIQPMQPMPSAPSPSSSYPQQREEPKTVATVAPPLFTHAAPAPQPMATATLTAAGPAESVQSTPQRRATRRRREPDTPPDSADDDDAAAAASDQVLPAGSSKRAQDEFLVRMRRQGVPYKTILANGNFKVEEATLRTRHRSLVKRPEERPRVPEWTTTDVSFFPSPSLSPSTPQTLLSSAAV
ncbi:hypothetical protein RB599_001737 [Gaeumannomyces hyphopodioides]